MPSRRRPTRLYHRPKSRRKRRAWTFVWSGLALWVDSQVRRWTRRLVGRQRRRSRHVADRPREINWPLLAGTLVGVGVMVPAARTWHAWQVRSQVGMLQEKLDRLERDEQWKDVAQWSGQFLQLLPGDKDLVVRRARAYDKVASDFEERSRAAELYLQALGILQGDPREREFRLRAAELLLQLDQPQNAVVHADAVLVHAADDAAAWKLRARAVAEHARGTERVPMREAVKVLEEALQHNPGDLELTRLLAEVYREETKEWGAAEGAARADEVMDRLVLDRPDDAQVLLARAEYRRAHGLAEVDADIERALELAPDNGEVLLLAAQRARQRGEHPEAQRLYELAAEVAPSDRRAYLGWGDSLAERGKVEDALATWERGLSLVGGRDFFLQLAAVDALLDEGRLTEAEPRLKLCGELLRQTNFGPDGRMQTLFRQQVEFQRLRVRIAQGDFRSSIAALNRLAGIGENQADKTLDTTSLRVEVQLALAQCHEALLQFGQAAAAYQRAALLEPQRPEHLLGAARAWERAGRAKSAETLYERAAQMETASPDSWLAVAQTELRRQAKLPAEQRRWERFDRALARAESSEALRGSVALVEADRLALAGRTAEALKRLDTAFVQDPSSEPLARATLLGHEQWGKAADADRVLGQFQAAVGETPPVRELRAILLARRGESAQAETILRELWQQAAPLDRHDRLMQLARFLLGQDRLDDAKRVLTEGVSADAQERDGVRMLAELCLRTGDLEGARLWIHRMQEEEGTAGVEWRLLEAERNLRQSRRVGDQPFRNAVRLDEEIRRQQPGWAPGLLLHARLCEQRDQVDEAITNYLALIDDDTDNLVPFSRAVALMVRERRHEEAQGVLMRLKGRHDLPEDLGELALEMYLERGQVDEAEHLAQAACRRAPQAAYGHEWMGRVWVARRRWDDAEEEFRRAVEISPGRGRTWVRRIEMLAGLKREAEAREVLASLEQHAQLAEAERVFLAAQGAEALEDLVLADELFQQAVRLSPNNVEVLERAATFWTPRDLGRTIDCTLRAWQSDPESARLRRELAIVLSARGTPQDWEQVWKLAPPVSTNDTARRPEEVRLRVMLLMRRGTARDQREAIQLLEKLLAQSPQARSDDRYLLAELLDASGQAKAAQGHYESLCNTEHPLPAHVAGYVRWLLRRGSANAGERLAQLERLAPGSWQVVQLRAHWLRQQHREGEIEPLVQEHLKQSLPKLEDATARVRLAAAAAALYVELDRPKAAEGLLRQLAERELLGYQPLVHWLLEQGRGGEALEYCRRELDAHPSASTAILWCNTLMSARLDAEGWKRQEPRLVELTQTFPQDPAVLFSLATARFAQNRPEEAEPLYRQVLKLRPRFVAALNNLAMLLSDRAERQEEALALIRQAIEIRGAEPALEDTLGMVLWRKGQKDEALTIFRRLGEAPSVQAVHLFHLALVEESAGLRDEARRTMAKARNADLASLALLPQEQDLLARLEASLAP